jgi:hypothetical protein
MQAETLELGLFCQLLPCIIIRKTDKEGTERLLNMNYFELPNLFLYILVFLCEANWCSESSSLGKVCGKI